MTPTEYIQKELNKIKEFQPKSFDKEKLVDEIFRLLMSKKFRKYSTKPELNEHIKNAIKTSIGNNQPIKLVLPHGAYKLWRLEEAPNPDWAELFAAIYYTKWLEPICEIYSPGIHFEFLVDDLILSKINNIPLDDVYTYIQDFQKILNFVQKLQPKNLIFTIVPFQKSFLSVAEFEETLPKYINKSTTKRKFFTKELLKCAELNAKPTPEQLKDSKWLEKVLIIQQSYMNMKNDMGYYSQPNKIYISCQPRSEKFLCVGTTKTSIAKFWVGVGALKKIGDEFIEYILSPNQLETQKTTKENISIKGLDSKNFSNIRIFN